MTPTPKRPAGRKPAPKKVTPITDDKDTRVLLYLALIVAIVWALVEYGG